MFKFVFSRKVLIWIVILPVIDVRKFSAFFQGEKKKSHPWELESKCLNGERNNFKIVQRVIEKNRLIA